MGEHGEYTVAVEGSIIKVTFIGMFNDIASISACAEVKKLIEGMQGRRFCMLYDLLNYEGSTPESHKISNQHFSWLEQQNCLGRASIVSNTFLIDITRNQQASLRDSKVESRMFENEGDAIAWLQPLLE